MAKDLTNSPVDRQNILNNPYAVTEIKKATHLTSILFEGTERLTKEQISAFFEVDARTIERYLEKYGNELGRNGYEVIRGNRLKSFKKEVKAQFVPDIHVGDKTPQLGIFDFRAFLNVAMLLTESERARLLRQAILDIVIDAINQRSGGGTKYINQRDEDFLLSWFQEENYRKEFTDALRDYVVMGNFKYPMYTDKIYVSIFRGNAQEYRKILRLQTKDKVRDTFYSEILDLIAAYEYGFAKVLEEAFRSQGRGLTSWQVDMDLAQFFNEVNHDMLLARIGRKVKDRRVKMLIRLYLRSGVVLGGVVSVPTKGTPQGGPLSPLLSNIVLDDLDKELESRGHKFCRYADDCNIYVASRQSGERVMESITRFVEQRLKLRVNQEKSAVARPWHRKFLGYSFSWHFKTRISTLSTLQRFGSVLT